MMTSESVAFKAKFTNSFISWKSQVPFLIYSVFCFSNYSVFYESYELMMSSASNEKFTCVSQLC